MRPFFSTLIGLSCAAASVAATPGALTRGPYVQLSTPDAITIVWRTEGRIVPAVFFGPAPGHWTGQVARTAIVTRVAPGTNDPPRSTRKSRTSPAQANAPLHSAPADTFQYEARLTGLTPSTRYYYLVQDATRPLTTAGLGCSFNTHPPPGKGHPTRFWVIGDSGSGREAQVRVARAMQQQVRGEGRPIDFMLHVGDVAYSRGRDVEFQTRFFESYGDWLQRVVCWAALGNHEGSLSKGKTGTGPYFDAFVLPRHGEAGGVASGTEAFYSFDYGAIHFVCLDTHDLDRTAQGAMARWLEADLAATSAQWIIAWFHHAPFSQGSHDSDKERTMREVREYLVPILEHGGVDVVFSGHSHTYERSMLIDGAYTTPITATGVVFDDGDGNPASDGPYRKSEGRHPHQGTVYVVAGHAGTNLGRKGQSPVMRVTLDVHGSVIVDIDSHTLTARMLDADGRVRDQFALVKQGNHTPGRIAQPWQPPAWVRPKGYRSIRVSNEPPHDHRVLIPAQVEWLYLAGRHPEGLHWTKPEFAAEGWKAGVAGFGYGDGDDRTVLSDMPGRYSVVYTRRNFVVPRADHVAELGLLIRYDDAFIAYLNGKELLRKGVLFGSGPSAVGVEGHASQHYEYFALKGFEKHLRNGTNTLAIEGHNKSRDSSDFTLDAYLIVED